MRKKIFRSKKKETSANYESDVISFYIKGKHRKKRCTTLIIVVYLQQENFLMIIEAF
jgi:hypothetical protein